MRIALGLVASALAVAALGCSEPDEELPGGYDGPVNDVRIGIPAHDPDFFDIITPDVLIHPGEEKMMCLHVTAPEDMAVDNFLAGFAAGGHHVSLFRTTDPKAPGTLEDCTDAGSNRSLEWWIVTIALTSGRALWIPKDMQFVMQFHYINAGDLPMLVRDVGRLHKVPESSVTEWVAPMTAQAFDLDIAPGRSTRSWECAMPFDRQLLTVFGHMHEVGAKYTLDMDDSVRLHTVDPWKASLRDFPPQTMYWGSPKALPTGTRLRYTCEWNNTTSQSIGYPAEMCLTFAYVGGGKEPFQCLPP